jgi:hypothetical protein
MALADMMFVANRCIVKSLVNYHIQSCMMITVCMSEV